MSACQFVHLRSHSEYSISDSIVRIDALAQAAAGDSQPAVALTDLANLFGWIKFYRACRSAGVQPVCGVDVWLHNAADPDRPARVLLLARNNAGYKLLCELISRAWLENEYRGRGEVRREWLKGCADRLIVLSGAGLGDVGQALVSGAHQQARKLAQAWREDFGDGYFIELHRLGSPESESLVRQSVRLAAQLGIPLVATHPVQFIGPEEYRAHEARVCISEGEILANPRRSKRFLPTQFFMTQAQMVELFADLPQALANSLTIAQSCSVTMTLGKARLPEFPIPDGLTLEQYLRDQALGGLHTRMQKLFPDEQQRREKLDQYQQRLTFECDTILAMGFPGYFLIVADFINWAKANGVPVGPGRGSGAGSLVAFALGITDLDPIPYALLFERFLNPERVSMPDFDIDFCQDNRYKVIDYVRSKYGEQAVSQIATFGTMASKAVIRDAGRVLDMGYNFCDQLSKLIPVVQNKPLSLEKAREAEPLLAERERNEDEVRELLALAGPLEDLTRNVGMHAGGVLIAPGRLTDFCPLYKAPGTDSVISQFDKDDVEAVGLVKFDFLGLRNLTIIDLAVRYINERNPELNLDLSLLEFNDPKAYQVLKDANTTAIFQVEGDGMKKLLKKLAPDRFEDIIAVLALYRPGPLGSGMVDDFILRKKGQQEIDYFHTDLTATLEPTYGVIVYQEQVMQIAQIIGGYTLGSADLLRRAMGKKKPEEMAQHRGLFVEGAKNKGYSEVLANKLFDLMAMFAEYGFNKSHTAAYAVVTYQTAWLKAHYPAEFLAATLSSDMDDTDKMLLFVNDCKLNKVEVLPPDINSSVYRFVPVGPKLIRYGLGAVKGAGESAVLNIISQRNERPYTDLFDFARRIDRRVVNRRAIEALIRAGAFDSLDTNRAKLLAHVGKAVEAAEAVAAHAGQSSLFGGSGEDTAQDMVVWTDVAPWSERERLREEKAALGLYLSGHLFSGFQAEVRRFAKARLTDLQPGGSTVWIAGIVSAIRTAMTRRGKMAMVTLDDGSGHVELSVYSEMLERYRNLLKEDELLIANVKISKDDYNGGLRVSVDEILDLCAARERFGKRVFIKLNGVTRYSALRRALLDHRVLSGAAAQNTGLQVLLGYHNEHGQCEIELGQDWRVRPRDEMLQSVVEHLHPQQVAVVY